MYNLAYNLKHHPLGIEAFVFFSKQPKLASTRHGLCVEYSTPKAREL